MESAGPAVYEFRECKGSYCFKYSLTWLITMAKIYKTTCSYVLLSSEGSISKLLLGSEHPF